MRNFLKKYSYFLPFVIFLILGIILESLIVIMSTFLAYDDIIFGVKINWFYFTIFLLGGNALLYVILSILTSPFMYFKNNIKRKLVLLATIVFGTLFSYMLINFMTFLLNGK
jgi:hypothetical protein